MQTRLEPRWLLVAAVQAVLPSGCSVEPTANVSGVTLPATETGDPDASSTTTSSETTGTDAESSSATSAVADTSGSSSDSGAGVLLDVGSGETGVVPACEDSPDMIHVLVSGNEDGEIWSFDPETVTFAQVTTLSCDELASAIEVQSFSIDRDGQVWVLSRHPIDEMLGNDWPSQLTRFSPESSTCSVIWYGVMPESHHCGDVAFVSTLADADHERLFVHACTGGGFQLDAFEAPRLMRFDPLDEAPSPIALGTDTFSSAPIAGTGDGRLYGVVANADQPTSASIVEFDQETGAILTSIAAPDLDIGDNAGQLALAFYAGDLYAFGIHAEVGLPAPELLIRRFDLDDDDGNGEHDVEPLVPAPLPFLSWTLVAAASPTCIPTGPAG